MEDHETIRQVLDGDVEAFGLLVRRYQRPVFSLIGAFVRDHHAGEDLAQEVFLAAYRNLQGYDPRRASFATWLLTIARNKCINAVQKKSPALMGEAPPAVDKTTPEDRLSEKELSARLDRALEELPVEQKTAFVLAELVGLSCDEVARIEKVQPGTARSRLSRARAALRSRLEDLAGGDS